jgi:hypothetical protein
MAKEIENKKFGECFSSLFQLLFDRDTDAEKMIFINTA